MAGKCTPHYWARFLCLARSNLRLCSDNHRAGYFSNMTCDWLSIVWANSEQETEKRALSLCERNPLITGEFLLKSICNAELWCPLCCHPKQETSGWITSELPVIRDPMHISTLQQMESQNKNAYLRSVTTNTDSSFRGLRQCFYHFIPIYFRFVIMGR